jgi:hypothetical protein
MDDGQQADDAVDVPASSVGDAAGRKLKPTAGNPWYGLATVHGKQTGNRIDEELHARNRRSWNRWMAAALNEAERHALVEMHDVDPADLVPLPSDDPERGDFEKRVSDRLAPQGLTLPDPGTPTMTDFGGVEFSDPFLATGFEFPGMASFEGASFRGLASFGAQHSAAGRSSAWSPSKRPRALTGPGSIGRRAFVTPGCRLAPRGGLSSGRIRPERRCRTT